MTSEGVVSPQAAAENPDVANKEDGTLEIPDASSFCDAAKLFDEAPVMRVPEFVVAMHVVRKHLATTVHFFLDVTVRCTTCYLL